jgi:2-keto-4-pentenoate hydratase
VVACGLYKATRAACRRGNRALASTAAFDENAANDEGPTRRSKAMRQNRAERAAAALLEASDRALPVADFPADCKPRSAAEAYEVQDVVVRRRGPIVAWKVGAPSPGGEVSFAPIFTLIASPASVAAVGLRLFGVEAEVAFRLAHDLPARATPYSRDEIVAAIASAHPVIELLESRFVDRDRVDAAARLADSLSNFALVHGPAIAGWPALDFDPARPPV